MSLVYGDIPGTTYGDSGSGTGPPAFTGLDPELVVTAALRTDTAVAALVAGVSTELPAAFETPWVRVVLQPGSTQAGGQHEDHRLHRYRLAVEVWDRSKESARAAMTAIADALLALPGAHAGGYVTNAELEGLPYWLPDPDDDYARYVAALTLHLHAR